MENRHKRLEEHRDNHHEAWTVLHVAPTSNTF